MSAAEIGAKVEAGRLLLKGAARTSSIVDSFSNWLIGGVGAALALLVANADDIKDYLPIAAVKVSACWFVASFVVALFGKLVAIVVAASSGGGSDGHESGKDLSEKELDFELFAKEMIRPLFWPGRLFAQSMLRKAISGDLAVAGRMANRAGQVQSLLVLLQAVLSLVAIGKLVSGLVA